jgi:multiple sugar transport system permease protein
MTVIEGSTSVVNGARWGRLHAPMTETRPRVRIARAARSVAAYAAVGVVGLAFLAPWLWLLTTSFKAQEHIFDWPPQWIPSPWVWSNYVSAVTTIPFFRYTANTLIICALVVVGRLISCSLVAYAFSRVRWPGRDALFLLVLSTMMLPFQVTMVPLYVIFTRIGWVNTFLPLTVPAFFGDAFFIFLLRQFFLTIPFDLSDAAKLDGASEFRIYSQIILPLAKPALATLAIFSFLWTYVDFLGPLIYLTDEQTWTLSIGLTQFLGTYRQDWGGLMAASALFTIPVIALFFFTQRYFIQGIATTGLK